MKTIIPCLLFSCLATFQVDASASSSHSEETLKKALDAHNKGEMFLRYRSFEHLLNQIQRKEKEIMQGLVEVASKPTDKDAKQNLDNKHREYCELLGEQEIMPQMSVYRLLLEKEMLEQQIQAKNARCCSIQ